MIFACAVQDEVGLVSAARSKVKFSFELSVVSLLWLFLRSRREPFSS